MKTLAAIQNMAAHLVSQQLDAEVRGDAEERNRLALLMIDLADTDISRAIREELPQIKETDRGCH